MLSWYHLLQVPLVAACSEHVGVVSSENHHTSFRHFRVTFKVELDDDEIGAELLGHEFCISLSGDQPDAEHSSSV